MNPFNRPSSFNTTPAFDVPVMTPGDFRGTFKATVLIHGGSLIFDKLMASTYQRGRVVTLRDTTVMIINVVRSGRADPAQYIGAYFVELDVIDLATALDSFAPDDGTGKKPVTFAEKIARSVEPKFGVMGKRKLLV